MTDYQVIHLLAVTLSKEASSLGEFQNELSKIISDERSKDNIVLRSAAFKLLYAIREYNLTNHKYEMQCAVAYQEEMDNI